MRQLVVLDLVTDLSIGVACAAIAFALIHFARRPTALPYGRVFVAFAVFVIADGATHLAAVSTLWQPSAWLATVLRLTTALAAVAVALLLPPLVPKTLALGAASALLDAAPDAIILIDASGTIRLVNERAERPRRGGARPRRGGRTPRVVPGRGEPRARRLARLRGHPAQRRPRRHSVPRGLCARRRPRDAGPAAAAGRRAHRSAHRGAPGEPASPRAGRGRHELARGRDRARRADPGPRRERRVAVRARPRRGALRRRERRAALLADARAVAGTRPDAGRRLVRPRERQAPLHAGRPRARRGTRPADRKSV